MAFNELLVDVLSKDLNFLKNTIQDMTDAELAQRPVPNANNPLWQIGHLIVAETMMVNASAGKTINELPAGFAERYSKQAAAENDPAKLGRHPLPGRHGQTRSGKDALDVPHGRPPDLPLPLPRRHACRANPGSKKEAWKACAVLIAGALPYLNGLDQPRRREGREKIQISCFEFIRAFRAPAVSTSNHSRFIYSVF
jgi:hypothetical protein